MDVNTINDDVTMAGDGAQALLMNRYRYIKQLGQGGMGQVYLVEDTLLDGKLFAIKMLSAWHATNKRAYQQLKSEAIVSMKLVHPNIVALRAFEEYNGSPCLVMDYIEGSTLESCLAEWGPIGEGAVQTILKPVAEALDYAHRKGVIHRDVKPSNVMITRDYTPYILDFGIAREIQESMTRMTGRVPSGTLPYMSPEQINGEAPSASQDVYSFAAMVYECLKGHPPFYRGQIDYQILHNEPEPLVGSEGFGARSIAKAVMAGLAKSAADRPRTCSEILAIGSVPSVMVPDRVNPSSEYNRGEWVSKQPMSGAIDQYDKQERTAFGVEHSTYAEALEMRSSPECFFSAIEKVIVSSGDSGFYYKDKISQKKLAGARSYHTADQDDGVIAVIDTTIFGSAKNGLTVSKWGIVWNNDITASVKSAYSWKELSCLDKLPKLDKSKIVFEDGAVFDFSGSLGNVVFCFNAINAMIKFAKESTWMDKGEGRLQNPSEKVISSVDVSKVGITGKCVYVGEAIPVKKRRNAFVSMQVKEPVDSIYLLVDPTVFGSAKEGLVITDSAVYFKNIFENPVRLVFDEIKTVVVVKDAMWINSSVVNLAGVPLDVLEKLKDHLESRRTVVGQFGARLVFRKPNICRKAAD